MAMAINDFESPEGGTRDRLARTLAVAGAIYGLMAAITGAVAVAGVFGLAGLAADPASVAPAQLLGLPWSLAAGAAGSGPAASLGVTLGALALNLAVLLLGSRLVRGRTARA
ncbi:MAG: hypothetical protein Q8J89_10215 [Caulobacter sp.]|nr:hypothetical protein [Caulobacter sp.]